MQSMNFVTAEEHSDYTIDPSYHFNTAKDNKERTIVYNDISRSSQNLNCNNSKMIYGEVTDFSKNPAINDINLSPAQLEDHAFDHISTNLIFKKD